MLLSLLSLAIASTKASDVLPIRLEGQLCHPRNLLVKLDSMDRAKALASKGITVLRTIPEIGYAVVQSPSRELQRTRDLLRRQAGVLQVDLDRAAVPAYVPNDPMWSDQWHTRAIKADLAWDTTKGDPGVIVAVIDTGVNMTHEDLAANIYTNPGETAGNGTDDDHNGYVDDVHGWDFVNNDNDPSDDFGHGTACSGLVAAIQDNNLGVTGVAPHCRIMPIKAATSSGYFYASATVPAYIYAANNGAKVFSMSYFADGVSPAEEVAMNYAVAHGVLPVAAAGNDSTVYSYYPGAYENVLSVAALNTDLSKAGFSDFGSWVDVASPGVSLATITNDGGYTTGFAGTSGACPQVAGIAALCFSVNPSASPEDVRNAIEDTAVLQNQAPFGEFSNYGLVDAQGAVLRMLGGAVAAHPPLVRWACPLPASSGPPHTLISSRIYGRGLGAPAVVSVKWNGTPLSILAQTRDYLDYYLPTGTGTLTLTVNGSVISTISPPARPAPTYPLIEASTQGATLNGGFAEALSTDGQIISCTRRSDGFIILQGTFRRIPKVGNMKLTVARRYEGTAVGTESIQLYDWSGASYPYADFITIGSNAVSSTLRTDTYSIPNGGRYVDDDGTVYFRIITSADIDSGGVLDLDCAFLNAGLSPGPVVTP